MALVHTKYIYLFLNIFLIFVFLSFNIILFILLIKKNLFLYIFSTAQHGDPVTHTGTHSFSHITTKTNIDQWNKIESSEINPCQIMY